MTLRSVCLQLALALFLLQAACGPEAPAPTLLGKLRLVCSVYDPATGTYVFNLAYFVQMIVSAVVLLLGVAAVVFEWRRGRGPRAKRTS